VHPARLALEERQELRDFDTHETALEQFRNGEAAAPIVHGHDDLRGAETLAQGAQVALGIEHALARHDRLLTRGLHEAQQCKPVAIHGPSQPGDRGGRIASPVDQHPSLEDVLIGHSRENQARGHDSAYGQDDRERRDTAEQVAAGIEIKQSRKDTRRHEQRQQEPRQHAAELRALARVVQAEGQQGGHHDCAERDTTRPQRTELLREHRQVGDTYP